MSGFTGGVPDPLDEYRAVQSITEIPVPGGGVCREPGEAYTTRSGCMSLFARGLRAAVLAALKPTDYTRWNGPLDVPIAKHRNRQIP